jgi:putative IMPACT (imprinted ancient) family translation regulator
LIENAVLQAEEGIDIQEASNITLNNITMQSKNTNPVAYVLNSDNITINNLKYKDSAEVLAMVQGDRTKAVSILNTDVTKAKQKLRSGFGVTDATVSWAINPVTPVDAKKKKNKAKGK